MPGRYHNCLRVSRAHLEQGKQGDIGDAVPRTGKATTPGIPPPTHKPADWNENALSAAPCRCQASALR